MRYDVENKAIVLEEDDERIIRGITNEEAGKVLRAVMHYTIHKEKATFNDRLLNYIFNYFTDQIDETLAT